MDILLWLVPPVVVTLVAMLWVSWLGRAGRGVVDRDEAVRRMGVVLEREPRLTRPAPRRPQDRSTGVAVRRTPPVTSPVVSPVPPATTAPVEAPTAPAVGDETRRRAS